MRSTTLLLAGLLLSAAALAQDPSEPIPVPKVGRVVDQTGTLGGSAQESLAAKLAAFERSKGSQVAVLLVPTIGTETIEEFATRVTDAWKLGRAGVDDGVLFVIVKQQRKMRIQTGRGVQGVLTDALSKRIVAERVAPLFRTGDFAGGVNAGVDAILNAIEGEPLPPPSKASGRKASAAASGENFLWIALLAVPVVAVILRSLVGRLAGAGLTSGVTGAAAWWIFGSLIAGGVVALLVFLAVLFFGQRPGHSGRGTGGWSGGSWGGGGGGFSGGGDSFSGGGGSFDGGGASGDW